MTSLHQLEHHDEFVERHIGPAENEIAAMLATVGAGSLDDLVAQTIPADILRAAATGTKTLVCQKTL